MVGIGAFGVEGIYSKKDETLRTQAAHERDAQFLITQSFIVVVEGIEQTRLCIVPTLVFVEVYAYLGHQTGAVAQSRGELSPLPSFSSTHFFSKAICLSLFSIRFFKSYAKVHYFH